jgi:DNA-binding transcriptional regulator/RsmH inhibitor MraZ
MLVFPRGVSGKGPRKSRWTLPQKYKEEIMSLNHDLVCTGHQGVQRTRERIKARYYWYRMHSDVRGFVKSCNKCNRNKKGAKNSFTAALAVVFAVCDGRGTISHHFVNWSTITKMLVFRRGVSGKGPRKSRWTLSIGDPA